MLKSVGVMFPQIKIQKRIDKLALCFWSEAQLYLPYICLGKKTPHRLRKVFPFPKHVGEEYV